jgi:hypothetical protein
MRAISAWVAIVSLSGCAALDRHEQRVEQRQLAWTGPGAGPCAFGGVTEAADAHCALLNFGTEGILQAVNEKVGQRIGPDASCTMHAAAVQRELRRHRALSTTPVYTCPLASRADGACHVSVLVTDDDGEHYVVDNGAVVHGSIGAQGVAAYDDFRRAVDDVMWIGETPTVEQIAQAIPGFEPKLQYFAAR